LVWFGGGVAGLTGLGLVLTRVIRSPQQVLADTAAPAPGVLTAPVEFRVLQDTVVRRGLVGAETSIEVTPLPAAGTAVVTNVRVKAGDEFRWVRRSWRCRADRCSRWWVRCRRTGICGPG
jgi:hypothetical protein